MAILPFVNTDELPVEYRTLLTPGSNLHRLIMHSLDGAKTFLEFGNWIRFKSHLNPRLRQMLILQVAHLLENRYQMSHHVKISRDYGVTEPDMQAIINETNGLRSTLGPLEKAALRATREMVTKRRLSPQTAAEVREYLMPELVVELVLIVGFYGFVAMTIDTLEVEVEETFIPYLAQTPFAE